MGTAAAWSRGILGRHAEYIDRTRDLWRRGRRADGGRCRHGKALVELPDQCAVEGIADDVRVRWKTVRRGGRGWQHYRLRPSISAARGLRLTLECQARDNLNQARAIGHGADRTESRTARR